MGRSYRVWVPLLFALLTLIGLGLALTNTSLGPAYFVINGQRAPWYDGALLAAVSFTALTFSLGGFYFPAWERRHAVLREEIVVGGRRVPALVFPYSTGALAFAACVAVMILTIGSIGSYTFLFFLALPALVVLMRAVFGREFVAITPDGLAWRVMPTDAAQGRAPAGSRDYFTRQPVQFVPWDGISEVALAEVPVTVSTRSSQVQVPAKMLRVRVSDRAALASLTSYQRTLPTDSGADVLLPLGWMNPRSRYAKFGDGETRAQPEAVWEAVEHCWRRPEERSQIGSPLGAATLASVTANAPPKPPPVAIIPPDADLDPRREAQRLGRMAAKQCQTFGGMLLIGLPCLVSLALMFTGHLSPTGTAGTADAFLAYMLVFVLPVLAAVGAAVAAFVVAPGQEAAAARSAVGDSAFAVGMLAVLSLGTAAWQYFDPRNFGHTSFPILPLVTCFVLCGLGLAAACALGRRLGCAAKTTGPPWLAHLLARWGRGLK